MLQLCVYFGTKYLMILERRKENKAASRWVLLEAFPNFLRASYFYKHLDK